MSGIWINQKYFLRIKFKIQLKWKLNKWKKLILANQLINNNNLTLLSKALKDLAELKKILNNLLKNEFL